MSLRYFMLPEILNLHKRNDNPSLNLKSETNGVVNYWQG